MPSLLVSGYHLSVTAGGVNGAVTVDDATGVLPHVQGWLRDSSEANPLEVEVLVVSGDNLTLGKIVRDADGRRLPAFTLPDMSSYVGGSLSLDAQNVPVNDTRIERLIAGDGVDISPVDGTGAVEISSTAGPGGVTSVNSGAGISVDTTTGDVTVTNDGVTGIEAGPGIVVDASTGDVTVSALQADWSTSLVRYFLLDYDGGDNTNVGYVDAAAGANISASVSGKARKTVAGLLEILPRFGDGRNAVVLVKARSGADRNYYKADGVTVDDLILNVVGYKAFMVRASTDLSNSTTDKRLLGAQTAVTGPNGDGSWTISAYTGRNTGPTQQITVASGSLPTDDSLKGRRCRIVSGTRANESFMSFRPVDTTHFQIGGVNGVVTGNDISVGESFWIEKAGVIFGLIQIVCEEMSGPISGSPGSALYLIGLRANTGLHVRGPNSFIAAFCETGGISTVRNGRTIASGGTWSDEAGTSFNSGGFGFRHESSSFGVGNFTAPSIAGFVSVSSTACAFSDSPRLSIVAPSYFKVTPSIASFGGAVAANPNTIGARIAGGGSSQPRVVFDGGSTLSLVGGAIDLVGIEFANMGSANLITLNGHGGIYSLSDVVLGSGTMTGVAVNIVGKRNTVITETSTGFGGTFNTASPSGGEIRLSDSSLTTWAALRAGSDFEDPAGNLVFYSGKGVRYRRMADGTEDVVARTSDPAVPPTGFIRRYWRSDLQESRYIDENGLVVQAFPRATWDPANVRYFLLDYDGGSDSNVGYVDAAGGADLTGLTTGKARKTVAGLLQILPKHGDARRAVILIKPRTGSDKKYYQADGVTADNLRIAVTGYTSVQVRASDLTNSTTDRLCTGTGVIASAGPNVDGSWTVGAVGGTGNRVITVAAGTLPTDNTLYGRRIRFTTGALAGKLNGVHRVVDSSNLVCHNTGHYAATTLPSVGDQFVIEQPAVEFTDIFFQVWGVSPSSSASFGNQVSQLHGLRANSTLACSTSMRLALNFIETSTGQLYNCGGLTISATGVLENGSVFRGGPGLRIESTAFSIAGCVIAAAVSLVTILNTSAFISIADIAGFNMGSGWYCKAASVQFSRCGTGGPNPANVAVSAASFGNNGSSTVERAYFENASSSSPIDLFQTNLDAYGIDFNDKSGSLITVRGMGLRVTCNDLVSSKANNTGTGLDLSQCSGGIIRIGNSVVPTATATAQEVLYNGGTATWANAATYDLLDTAGNRIWGASTKFQRITDGTTVLNALSTGVLAGSAVSAGVLKLISTTHATKSKVAFGENANTYYDETPAETGDSRLSSIWRVGAAAGRTWATQDFAIGGVRQGQIGASSFGTMLLGAGNGIIITADAELASGLQYFNPNGALEMWGADLAPTATGGHFFLRKSSGVPTGVAAPAAGTGMPVTGYGSDLYWYDGTLWQKAARGPYIEITLGSAQTTYNIPVDGDAVERIEFLFIIKNPTVTDEQIVMDLLDASDNPIVGLSSKYLVDASSGSSGYWRLADVYNNDGWTRVIGTFEMKTGKPRSFNLRGEQMTAGGTLTQWSTVGVLTNTTTPIKKLQLYGYSGGVVTNGIGADSIIKIRKF